MIYYLAEINPSIVFFVLWGILSWLSKNREKNAKLDDIKTSPINDESKINLGKQDYFEYENDIFENIEKDDFKEKSVNTKTVEISEENIHIDQEDYNPLETTVNIDTADDFKETKPNWLIKDLSNKKKIKKYLIFSEILKKPRSLNPY